MLHLLHFHKRLGALNETSSRSRTSIDGSSDSHLSWKSSPTRHRCIGSPERTTRRLEVECRECMFVPREATQNTDAFVFARLNVPLSFCLQEFRQAASLHLGPGKTGLRTQRNPKVGCIYKITGGVDLVRTIL